MLQVQQPMHSARSSISVKRRSASSRLLRCIFVGISLTLLLICIELAVTWVLDPFYMHGRTTIDGIAGVGVFLTHLPLLLLILVPLVELVAISLIAFVAMKPLAILAYLRDVQKAEKRYRKLYPSPVP